MKKEGTLHLVLRLRGGGVGPDPDYNRSQRAQMGVAAGGKITQVIKKDRTKEDKWHKDISIVFNVQILNSNMFKEVTGRAPPSTPVSARIYAQHGYPFFKLYEESSDVKGDFSTVKSVAEIDNEDEEDVDVPIKPIKLDTGSAYSLDNDLFSVSGDIANAVGPFTKFRYISEIEAEMKKMSLGVADLKTED